MCLLLLKFELDQDTSSFSGFVAAAGEAEEEDAAAALGCSKLEHT